MNDFDKGDTIHSGVFLADREENGLIVQLYSLDKLYAEVYYDPHANKILRINGFDTINRLSPYLTNINLNK
jgi:esterase/lipase superfamily enzyme